MAAHLGRAGEDDMVERQAGKGARHRGIALDHGHLVVIEGFGQQRAQRGRGVRRVFGGLHHAAVAGGQRRCQRTEREVDREIPRHHDADHALGLDHHARAVAEEQQFCVPARRLHPAPQAAQQVVDMQHRRQHVDHQRLGVGARAEVARRGGGEAVGVGANRAAQPLQRVPALRQRGEGRRHER
ncbi:hypothetical protein D3C72_1637060 [compost metagenome]